MVDFTFISGNAMKVYYLERWLGEKVTHVKFDLTEIQSLDLHEVVERKVKEAYREFKKPVLVEDISLEFHALGRLPGTFVKWFLEEMGAEGLCRLLDGYDDRTATVRIMYGLYDGKNTHYFQHITHGTIAKNPEGEHGKNAHGWNTVFIPYGTSRVMAEIPDKDIKQYSYRYKAVQKLKNFLSNK